MSHDIIFFAAVAAAISGQGMDVITTNAALANGWTETSKASAWAIKKIGFAAFAFLKVAALAIGGPVLCYSLGHSIVGSVVAGISAGVGFYAGIANYLLEKKAKISVF